MASSSASQASTRREPQFLLVQDVKCLHCGSIVGQLVRDSRAQSGGHTFRPGQNCDPQRQSPRGAVRCCRCGGPVYLDDMERMVRVVNEDLTPPRRGRRPKVDR